MALDKYETILEWAEREAIQDVQMFLGFAIFYQRPFEGFARKIHSITDLVRNDVPYARSHDCAKAFYNFKDHITKAPIIKHFESLCQLLVETDAHDFAIGAVLSKAIDGRLHHIGFYSRKMHKAEINYEIHEKEFLAIVAAVLE
jgi:hypothetical protein